jgi:hypothetical protein
MHTEYTIGISLPILFFMWDNLKEVLCSWSMVYALAYLSDIELCYVQIRIKMSERIYNIRKWYCF